MVRSFVPFLLALLGMPVIFFASIRPIFEWQISDVTVDSPSSLGVRSSPSPWKTWIGDSLEDKSYALRMIQVSENGKACSESDLNIVVQRSRSDELWEHLSLAPRLNYENIRWLIVWVWIEIVLSVIYIFWYTFWQEHRTFSYTLLFTGFATILSCLIMISMMKLMGSRLDFPGMASCHGTVMFSAKLLKVYYSAPILLLTGILAELGAFVMMIYQVVRAFHKRKESSEWAVG